jgi:glyoxylase-like metal-dependent hydrolase (beta-lactamase superfamily II)
LGGLTKGDQIVFANAVVRADKDDVAFWLSDENMAKAPDSAKSFFTNAKAALAPYMAANKLQTFEGSTELAAGVKSVATKGHTAGHSSYLVESKGQKLMVIGDLIHVGAVQFEQPSITIDFDSDNKAAEAQRKKVFADAAKAGYLVAGAHLQFPGLGHLRTEGKGYHWVPVNYTQLR